MRKWFLPQLIFSCFLVNIPHPLAITANDWLCPPALGNNSWLAGYEGQNGRDGRDGRAGRNGKNGESQTVFLQTTPTTINLSGTDGENGETGDNALAPVCQEGKERPERDLRMANGGKGGKGGDGGNGGNGGSIVIYYTNPTDLRQVTLLTSGGKGGRGGRGGNGSAGCRCFRHHWEIETCSGTPGTAEYKCKSKKFTCRDGANGDYGSDGQDGKEGEKGNLTLIKRQEILPTDSPLVKVDFLTWQQGVKVTRNYWETRNGAANLFAPGSIISDRYQELVERLEKSVELVWKNSRSLEDFKGEEVTISLDENRQINLNVPETVWLKKTIQEKNSKLQLVVSEAMLRSEALQLSGGFFFKNGKDLKLTVFDRSNKSDLVASEFFLTYSIVSDDGQSKVGYQGVIPADLIEYRQNTFTLNLGKLPIASEFLQPNLKVQLELVATRSFADNSALQTMKFTRIIPAK